MTEWSQMFGRAGGRVIHDTTDRQGDDANFAVIHSVPGSDCVIETIECFPGTSKEHVDIDQYQGVTLTHPWAIVAPISRLKLTSGKCHAHKAIGVGS